MGIFLNPSNEDFKEMVLSSLYVDKTDIITLINKIIDTQNKYICVSRPRRFGKTSTVNTLVAYYSKGCDSKDLFEKCAVNKNDIFYKNLNKYNVFSLNIKFFLRYNNIDDIIKYIEKIVLDELKVEFKNNVISDDLLISLFNITVKTGNKFIFIIDEWDCILREGRFTKNEIKRYLYFLELIFKDKKYISLVYMTGILPIKKYGTHSALNMFQEVSMINPGKYAEFTGFTDKDIEKIYNMDKNKIQKAMEWYDGYIVGDIEHIYNPQSIIYSIINESYSSYWTNTETYEALSNYISKNFDGLKSDVVKMIAKYPVNINPSKFQNDMTSVKTKDDVFTLLVHLGYLTYNYKDNTVCIPNEETKIAFDNSISDSGWKRLYDTIKQSEDLLQATLDKNQEAVSKLLQLSHKNLSSYLTYKKESDIVCSIIVAYYCAKKDFMIYREFASGEGFADIVFVPENNIDKPAIIVEVKYKRDAKTALNQIVEKEYTSRLEGYFGEIILVGLNYSPEKGYTCVIDSVYKE